MKLLWEQLESVTLVPEIITEGSTGKKDYFLYGPSIIAEQKNKNGRIYKGHIIEREVAKLMERIQNKDAGGELNHPQSPEINLERLSHYVTEVKREGNIWHSKLKVASTPMGQIVRNIIDDDQQKIGVSTRGLGTVGKDGYVAEDFNLICIDIVGRPSAPGAFVSAILEAKEYIINEKGEILEKAYDTFEDKLKSIPKKQIEDYLFKAVNEFVRSLK